MNKKDCEHLGYILSSSGTLEEAVERILRIYPLLGTEYRGFLAVENAEQEAMNLMKKKLEEKFGPSWFLKKACTKQEVSKAFAQAKLDLGVDE